MTSSTIYAIGDVHGRSDLLANMIDFIGIHAHTNCRAPQVYFLGDIVDRGHDARGAMEIVRKTIERWPGSCLLRGNHEQMFLNLLDNSGDLQMKNKLISNGGYWTLHSFIGYDEPYPRARRPTAWSA